MCSNRARERRDDRDVNGSLNLRERTTGGRFPGSASSKPGDSAVVVFGETGRCLLSRDILKHTRRASKDSCGSAMR